PGTGRPLRRLARAELEEEVLQPADHRAVEAPHALLVQQDLAGPLQRAAGSGCPRRPAARCRRACRHCRSGSEYRPARLPHAPLAISGDVTECARYRSQAGSPVGPDLAPTCRFPLGLSLEPGHDPASSTYNLGTMSAAAAGPSLAAMPAAAPSPVQEHRLANGLLVLTREV